MALSKLELAVETGKWDGGLKKAQTALNNFINSSGGLENALSKNNDKMAEFAKMMGNMGTTASTAKGSLKELNNIYTEMAVQYKRLSDEEKNSPFGKALGQSVEQLKGRLNDAKQELASVTGETKKNSSALDELASKFGLNISQLTKFGTIAGAATAAFQTMKGAIESNEATHDAYARAVEASSAVTSEFLRSLANADFSNFINGLQGVVNKAIEAYNAMDDFESYAARFNPKQAAMESQIQTKLQQARAAKAQGDIKKAEALTAEANTLIASLQKTTKAYGEKQTQGGYATIKKLMGSVNVSNSDIRWFADPANWDETNKKAKEYSNTVAKIASASAIVNSGGHTKEQYAAATKTLNESQAYLQAHPSLKQAYTFQNIRDSGDKGTEFNSALRNIYGNEMADSRVASLQARADRIDAVVTNATGGGRTGKVKKEVDMSFKVNPKSEFSKSDIAKILSDEPLAKKLGLTVDADNASGLRDMISGQTTPGDVVDPFKAKLRANADNYDYSKIEEAGKKAQEAWMGAANAIGSVGSALAGIEDPAAKVFGIIAQAIANVALSMAQALTKKESQQGGVWGWIAAAAAGTATMIGTISAIKSATSGNYAEGGIIPGNSSSGDNMRIYGVNSGELILNKAQQGVIANRLQNSAFGQMQLSATIKGEDIRLALNNGSRRRGKGEYVTSK